MRSRSPSLPLLCVLVSLLVPRIALAHAASGAENRVWAFDFQEHVHVGGAAALPPDLHHGYDSAECDSASASGAENGVWAFYLAEPVGMGVERSLTLEARLGCEPTCDPLESDSLLAPRGGRQPKPSYNPREAGAVGDIGKLNVRNANDLRKDAQLSWDQKDIFRQDPSLTRAKY